MDKAILVPSVILALVIILLYLFRCWKNKIEVNNSIIISSILNSSGIICGICLALSPIFPDIKKVIGGIDIYVFIGGVAVLFVSSQGIHRDVVKSTIEDETANNLMSQTENTGVLYE